MTVYLVLDFYENPDGDKIGVYRTLRQAKNAEKQRIFDTDGECTPNFYT